MDYTGWVNAVCAVLEYQVVNASSATPTGTIFDTVIAPAIAYTENRIQRDLNLLSVTTTANGTMTANSRSVTLPVPTNGIFFVTKEIRPIVAGVKQQPLELVSRSFLDFAWPSDTSPGANIPPIQWAPNDQTTIRVGPAPDQNYSFEAIGTTRFAPLSATNTTNFLSLYFPDMYVAASLVWLFGFQRDFGGQSDDPQAAQSWENQYKTLLAAASAEEARKWYADMFPVPSNPAASVTEQG